MIIPRIGLGHRYPRKNGLSFVWWFIGNIMMSAFRFKKEMQRYKYSARNKLKDIGLFGTFYNPIAMTPVTFT